MTNRDWCIKMITERKEEVIPFYGCPPTFKHCPADADGKNISCKQCQTKWLDAEREE